MKIGAKMQLKRMKKQLKTWKTKNKQQKDAWKAKGKHRDDETELSRYQMNYYDAQKIC